MSTQIDKFCSDLRLNLTMVDDKLQALKAKATDKADEAESAARQQMDALQKKIDEGHAAVAAAEAKIKEWVEAQKSEAQSKIAEWKSKGDEKSLRARADLADAYAKAMSVIASSAVNKAAKAALGALVAEYDVATSKVARAVR